MSSELEQIASNPASPIVMPVPEWDVCDVCREPKPDVQVTGRRAVCGPCSTPTSGRRSPRWGRK